MQHESPPGQQYFTDWLINTIVTCGQDDDLRDEKPSWWVICQNRQRPSKAFRNMTMTAVICCKDFAEIAGKGAEVWGIWGNRAGAVAEAQC